MLLQVLRQVTRPVDGRSLAKRFQKAFTSMKRAFAVEEDANFSRHFRIQWSLEGPTFLLLPRQLRQRTPLLSVVRAVYCSHFCCLSPAFGKTRDLKKMVGEGGEFPMGISPA